MSEYQGCHKCKYGNNQPIDYPCLECEHNRAIDHYEPMTNADRILMIFRKKYGISIGGRKMRKRKPTITEIELDRIGKRDRMASHKPRQNAMECFKRAPYTTTKKER